MKNSMVKWVCGSLNSIIVVCHLASLIRKASPFGNKPTGFRG